MVIEQCTGLGVGAFGYVFGYGTHSSCHIGMNLGRRFLNCERSKFDQSLRLNPNVKLILLSYFSLFTVHLIPPGSMRGSYLEYKQKAQITKYMFMTFRVFK